jgi:hypothetical protein
VAVLGRSIRFDGSVSAVVPEARCRLTPCQRTVVGLGCPLCARRSHRGVESISRTRERVAIRTHGPHRWSTRSGCSTPSRCPSHDHTRICLPPASRWLLTHDGLRAVVRGADARLLDHPPASAGLGKDGFGWRTLLASGRSASGRRSRHSVNRPIWRDRKRLEQFCTGNGDRLADLPNPPSTDPRRNRHNPAALYIRLQRGGRT